MGKRDKMDELGYIYNPTDQLAIILTLVKICERRTILLGQSRHNGQYVLSMLDATVRVYCIECMV